MRESKSAMSDDYLSVSSDSSDSTAGTVDDILHAPVSRLVERGFVSVGEVPELERLRASSVGRGNS